MDIVTITLDETRTTIHESDSFSSPVLYLECPRFIATPHLSHLFHVPDLFTEQCHSVYSSLKSQVPPEATSGEVSMICACSPSKDTGPECPDY